MEIKFSQVQSRVSVTVFHINGNLDAETHHQLEEQVQQAIQNGSRHFVLDLKNVSYVSSYGIRSISQIFKVLRNLEGVEDHQELSQGLRDGTFKSSQLKLANPSENVMKVLTLSGMDMFLEIYSGLEKAVNSF